MLGSWKIARLFGIDIRIHWTFLILVAVVMRLGDPVMAGLVVTATFLSVLLHELGHSLVAKRFGVQVMDISFWPLGGMARMTAIPEEPRVEGWIAIAGPAVNFALIALALPVALVLAAGGGNDGPLFIACLTFIIINVMLGTFNLVPAFPMDGGRILRSLLARRFDYVKSTEIAVRVGRWIAAGMMFLALISAFVSTTNFCILPLIAVFIWFAGGRELMAVRLRHGQSPFGGRFPFAPTAPHPAESSETDMSPRSTTEPARGGARRPSAWELGGTRRSGFSEEELRKLERFRGRLQRPPQEEE